MEFLWLDPGSTEFTQKEIWKALELALINEEGVCYRRHPVFSQIGRAGNRISLFYIVNSECISRALHCIYTNLQNNVTSN